MRRITDLSQYLSVLPYASELLGVYQPLIGWKSQRLQARFSAADATRRVQALDSYAKGFRGRIAVAEDEPGHDDGCRPPRVRMGAGTRVTARLRQHDSTLLNAMAGTLPEEPPDAESLLQALSPQRVERALLEQVLPRLDADYAALCPTLPDLAGLLKRPELDRDLLRAQHLAQLQRESALAGALGELVERRQADALRQMFYAPAPPALTAEALAAVMAANSGVDAFVNLNNLDPRRPEHIGAAALSPLAVVHLFRQYFFELDTFLGTPVGHVWLSPGSSVELIETHSTRTLTERAEHISSESTLRHEETRGEREELAESTRADNRQDIGLGASVTASYMSVTASSSLDFKQSQQTAREQSYRRMREQSSKLSSEIRRNVQTSLRVVTEVTDTSSKRYTLANKTERLINYEMRRKMRQVGVQVQDIGTYLCWQGYVDDPGAALGVAEFVHVGKRPDIGEPPPPDAVAPQTDFSQELAPVRLPFVPLNDHDDRDEDYDWGAERNDPDPRTKYRIQWQFPQTVSCDKPNYVLDGASVQVTDGSAKVEVSDLRVEGSRGSFTLVLAHAHFGDREAITVKPTVHWRSTMDSSAVDAANKAKMDAWRTKERQAWRDAFLGHARERIKLASRIRARPAEELREEERMVVYRAIVQGLLMKGIAMPDEGTRHIVSALIADIFDVDKMLYFVCPEWWRPRRHKGRQRLGSASSPEGTAAMSTSSAARAPDAAVLGAALKINADLARPLSAVPGLARQALASANARPQQAVLAEHVVGWGGLQEGRDDNYWITEDSDPARLGASLGWLLQLDGDNLRNAFLNAPWVKAVIPVRPGKELAALNWLQGVEGMNGIGETDLYHTDNPEETDADGVPYMGREVKLLDVIRDLAIKVQRKHRAAMAAGQYPKPQDLADPALVDEANTVTATPLDRVYEHGFYPLKGGFKAAMEEDHELVAQWIEVLPTDQIVPVEVRYDPRTGRMLPPQE